MLRKRRGTRRSKKGGWGFKKEKQKDVENRKGKSIPERQLQIAQTRYCKATNKSRDATFIDLQLISHHVAVQPGLAFKD